MLNVQELSRIMVFACHLWAGAVGLLMISACGEPLTETRPERMSATTRALACQGDTTPPAIFKDNIETHGIEEDPQECTGFAMGNVWVAPNITATDACEGSVPVYRFNTGDDDQDGIPGSVDPDDFGRGPTTQVEGRYQVEYLAWDSHFNLARTSLWVNVLDTLRPVLSLNGAQYEQVECFRPARRSLMTRHPTLIQGLWRRTNATET